MGLDLCINTQRRFKSSNPLPVMNKNLAGVIQIDTKAPIVVETHLKNMWKKKTEISMNFIHDSEAHAGEGALLYSNEGLHG